MAIADAPEWLAVIDRAVPDVRLAALLVPLRSTAAPATNYDPVIARQVDAMLRELKFSNDEAALAAQLVAVAHAPVHDARDHALLDDDIALRRLLSRLDRDRRELALRLWQAEAPGDEVVARAARVLAAGPPLSVGDLAIKGNELMKALAIAPGPIVGRILAELLASVIEDPARNTREALLAQAQQLELAVAHDDDND